MAKRHSGNRQLHMRISLKLPEASASNCSITNGKYSSFTYRDTASKIYLTSPVNILTNNVDNVNSPYLYNPTKIVSPKDTTISIYVSDPDSNYSDVSVTLNGLSMKMTVRTQSAQFRYRFLPCRALKLTDGILKNYLKRDSVVLKTQTQLGALNVNCLVCNWKATVFHIHGLGSLAVSIYKNRKRLLVDL